METTKEQKKIFNGFLKAKEGKLVFKRYKNRKIYCLNYSSYVNLADCADMIREMGDFDIHGMDKKEFLYSVIFECEKQLKEEDKASDTLLMKIIQASSLSKFVASKTH